MTTLASAILRRVTDTLMDSASIRWPIGQLVRALNDAQRTIVLARRDATHTTATVTLAAGAKQSLKAMALVPAPYSLIGVRRNAAGSQGAISLIERHMLDSYAPNWQSGAGTASIQHYMYDAKDPETFYCYPPALNTAQVVLDYSAYPVDIAEPAAGATFANVAGNLSVDDIFDGVVVDLVLYRAYLSEAEFAGNGGRAEMHKNAAIQQLGGEAAGTAQSGPTKKPDNGG